MELDMDHQQHSPSFRRRLKCCFSSFDPIEPASPASSSSSGSDDDGFHRKRLVSRSSPTSGKNKCAALFSKIGGAGRGFRRPSNTADYRYDATSYSLNFDDESEYPVRSFASRLPSSPPPANGFPVAASGRIVAWT